MKIKLFISLFIPILIIQCSLFSKHSTYYTETEKTVLEKTLGIIGYDYGYDSNLGMDHIYSSGFSDVEEIIRDNSRGQSIIESIELLCDELFILKRMSVEIGNYAFPSTKECQRRT